MLRPETPIPGLRRTFQLHPENDNDPYVFRIDLSDFGIGTSRVIFSRDDREETKAFHLDFALMSFDKQAAIKNPRRWITGALAVGAASAIAWRSTARHMERHDGVCCVDGESRRRHASPTCG
jgi:hypothetical protein